MVLAHFALKYKKAFLKVVSETPWEPDRPWDVFSTSKVFFHAFFASNADMLSFVLEVFSANYLLRKVVKKDGDKVFYSNRKRQIGLRKGSKV